LKLHCVSEVSAAVGACPFAEGGGADGDGVVPRAPFETIEGFVEGLVEEFSGDGDAAAEEDDFGIEDIDEGRDGGGEGFDGGFPDLGGIGVAGLDGFEKIGGVGEAAV
jgi:hypothetical protein